MPKIPFFTGDFYTLDDPGSEIAQIINMYPEVIESGTGKDVGRLVGTPGHQLFTVVGAGPIRALWMGNGVMFAVSGSHLYQVFGDGEADDLGDVGNNGQPAQIFPSGRELLVISGGFAWRVYGDDTGYHVAHIQLIAAEYTDLAVGVKAFIYDLEINDSDDTKVTSATRPFVAGDVGLELTIVQGIDFTPAIYAILSVAGGYATLNTSAGLVGSTGGEALLLDGNNDTVTSPTLPFLESDEGGTLVISEDSPTGWTPGTYDIVSVEDGIATLNASPGAEGATGGIATQYPGESGSTDADGNLKAGTGAYLDGYGIVAPPPQATVLTNVFYISDPTPPLEGSFLRWLALDKGTKEAYPDNILALLADHQELYVYGDLQSVEAWRDTGAANFPFERDQGATMTYGLAAQWSVSQLGTHGIAWLAWGTNKGSPQAWYSVGFQPRRISTAMLEHIWGNYAEVRDARAFSYVEDSHHFYVLSFPTANITWCYDLTASEQAGKPMWHVRAVWNEETSHWNRIRSDCHTYGFFTTSEEHPALEWSHGLTHYTGDYADGRVYVQGLYNYLDVDVPIRRELIMPHMANENLRTVWHLFQLECLVGSAASDTEDVIWTLEYSRDRGATWVNARVRTALATGKRNQRLRWWRCGESYDQVWRLVTDSAAKVSITSAWFDASGATS